MSGRQVSLNLSSFQTCVLYWTWLLILFEFGSTRKLIELASVNKLSRFRTFSQSCSSKISTIFGCCRSNYNPDFDAPALSKLYDLFLINYIYVRVHIIELISYNYIACMFIPIKHNIIASSIYYCYLFSVHYFV